MSDFERWKRADDYAKRWLDIVCMTEDAYNLAGEIEEVEGLPGRQEKDAALGLQMRANAMSGYWRQKAEEYGRNLLALEVPEAVKDYRRRSY